MGSNHYELIGSYTVLPTPDGFCKLNGERIVNGYMYIGKHI